MEDKVFSPATETVVQASSAASEMTGDDAVDSHENASSKWTNEKHNLYLKSIEASFVDQLYNSLDMLSRQTQITNRSDACISSGQCKVLRRGCWSKKSFNREKFQGYWIQHFKKGSCKRLSLTALQYPVTESKLDQHAIVAEVTDQNFVEDTSCSRKRARVSKYDHASNDQVVPQRTSAATTEVPDSYVSPKK
ncbi:hypothetical protein HanRHA438_Chr16g0747841 [Helianthus annuus]|uniref:Uncharacterized protein n=1 Tax=Helianthus annuus TaxID=4232 RepID=A0A251SK88_HELAN|nr:cold-regulated protein 27 isoform X1 [Helianthus annuus]KAF5758948.1 hypothetical protein HanXRQr2_Chr16g0735331 [Helianthus annuus]KAJ0834804.1 hypothetical protein HanRHA438_Chr16g0747841 [Helianthus annuus]